MPDDGVRRRCSSSASATSCAATTASGRWPSTCCSASYRAPDGVRVLDGGTLGPLAPPAPGAGAGGDPRRRDPGRRRPRARSCGWRATTWPRPWPRGSRCTRSGSRTCSTPRAGASATPHGSSSWASCPRASSSGVRRTAAVEAALPGLVERIVAGGARSSATPSCRGRTMRRLLATLTISLTFTACRGARLRSARRRTAGSTCPRRGCARPRPSRAGTGPLRGQLRPLPRRARRRARPPQRGLLERSGQLHRPGLAASHHAPARLLRDPRGPAGHADAAPGAS